MTGNSYNKKSGQVLLITVMLLAVVLTITLAVTFRSNTETQLTKLEEESQKSLAAAEAGVEAALSLSPGQSISNIGNLPGLSGFTGLANVSTTKPGSRSQFVTPLLQKDQQYTFYLADYKTFNSPYTGSLTVYYDSESAGCSNIALELTLIYNYNPALNNQPSIKKFVADVGVKITSSGSIGSGTGGTVDNQTFSCRAALGSIGPTYNPANVLIVRTLFAPTKLGFDGGVSPLPIQGKYITSTATSNSNITKSVLLFQSYPQIPAEFFVTSF